MPGKISELKISASVAAEFENKSIPTIIKKKATAAIKK
jgi:hypothetical protein